MADRDERASGDRDRDAEIFQDALEEEVSLFLPVGLLSGSIELCNVVLNTVSVGQM